MHVSIYDGQICWHNCKVISAERARCHQSKCCMHQPYASRTWLQSVHVVSAMVKIQAEAYGRLVRTVGGEVHVTFSHWCINVIEAVKSAGLQLGARAALALHGNIWSPLYIGDMPTWQGASKRLFVII
jgi:hypothetical protein